MTDTEVTGTLLAAAWNCETQTLAAAAPGTRRDRPDAQELGNADRGHILKAEKFTEPPFQSQKFAEKVRVRPF